MKNLTRFTALLLCAVLAFSSCAQNPSAEPEESAQQSPSADTESVTAVEEEEPVPTDGLPDTDMDGFAMNILHHDQSWLAWAMNVMEAEELTGETLNDAFFARKAAIDERFNCDVNFDTMNQVTNSIVDSYAMAGDDSYDVLLMYDLNVQGSLSSLYDMQLVPHLNLDEPWWNPEASAMFRLGGIAFAEAGNYSLSVISRAGGYVFNKDRITEFGLESPYELVKNGTWTIDKMYEMAGMNYLDVNGDGKMDGNDYYGIVSSPKEQFLRALFGCEVQLVTQDADGFPVFALEGNEESVNRMQHIIDLSVSTSGFLPGKPSDIHGSTAEYGGAFANQRAMFEASNPNSLAGIRDYDFDVGFVVVPKWSEEQENYYAPSFGAEVSVMLKSFPEARADYVGMLMEALAFYTHYTVLPEYTETLIKTKYARDVETAEMLEIAFNSIYFDFGINVWQEACATPLISGCFLNLNGDFGSKMKVISKQITAQTKKIVKAVEGYNG